MLIELKNRYTGEVVISGDYKNLIDCVEKNKDRLDSRHLEAHVGQQDREISHSP